MPGSTTTNASNDDKRLEVQDTLDLAQRHVEHEADT